MENAPVSGTAPWVRNPSGSRCLRRSAPCSSGERDPPVGGLNRCPPEVIRRLAPVQCFSDFANRKERAGPGFFDFQPLILVCLNEADETIQDRQCLLPRLALGKLQGPHDFVCSREIIHRRSPVRWRCLTRRRPGAPTGAAALAGVSSPWQALLDVRQRAVPQRLPLALPA
jgi:hypothetical protein